MQAKILYVIETVSRAIDRNGNRYHFARITSTVSGRDLVIRDTSPSNGRHYVLKSLEAHGFRSGYENLLEVEVTLAARDWDRADKNVAQSAKWQFENHDLIDALWALHAGG